MYIIWLSIFALIWTTPMLELVLNALILVNLVVYHFVEQRLWLLHGQ